LYRSPFFIWKKLDICKNLGPPQILFFVNIDYEPIIFSLLQFFWGCFIFYFLSIVLRWAYFFTVTMHIMHKCVYYTFRYFGRESQRIPYRYLYKYYEYTLFIPPLYLLYKNYPKWRESNTFPIKIGIKWREMICFPSKKAYKMGPT
jgi:hypothetical protein